MGRQARDVSSEEMNPPFGWLDFSADQAEERRLSGAVRANEGSTLAAPDHEAHTIHSVKAVECLRDVRETQGKSSGLSHILK
jgi:hypothetical protein